MINQDTLSCPLCNFTAINFVSAYPGSFLSCTELYQCQSCGLIFAHKLPPKDKLDEYYASGLYFDKVADPYSTEFEIFSFNLARSRLRLLNSKLRLPGETLKVIDIGAGNARFGMALKEAWPRAIYDAVEPDTAVSKKYGDWVRSCYHEVKDVDYAGYDLAVMNQVLEHVSDPLEFLVSVCSLITPKGFVYIDVPYHDYLFKPSVAPHLLFWSKKSLSVLLEKMGLRMIFCDTAGMPHSQAKVFFSQQSTGQKIGNLWIYAEKANRILNKLGAPRIIDTFRQFQADHYGGDRQWLRCIGQRMD